jgi:hypothetical protein
VRRSYEYKAADRAAASAASEGKNAESASSAQSQQTATERAKNQSEALKSQ